MKKNKAKLNKLNKYKCCFNAYSRTVVSLTVRANSVESAIDSCKIILGEMAVKCCLISVELEVPF